MTTSIDGLSTEPAGYTRGAWAAHGYASTPAPTDAEACGPEPQVGTRTCFP